MKRTNWKKKYLELEEDYKSLNESMEELIKKYLKLQSKETNYKGTERLLREEIKDLREKLDSWTYWGYTKDKVSELYRELRRILATPVRSE